MGQDLLALEPHERATAGLFLGFQYPVEIPGSPTFNSYGGCQCSAQSQRRRASIGWRLFESCERKASLLQMDMEMLKRQ